MREISPNEILPIVKDMLQERFERALPIFAETVKEKIELCNFEAVKEFYESYDADNRAGSLFDVATVDLKIGGDSMSLVVNFDMSIEKPSWHNTSITDGLHIIGYGQVAGYPENIYESVYEEGYHGGRGATHSLWGFRTATKTESPYDLFVKKIQEYANSGQPSADLKSAWDSIG